MLLQNGLQLSGFLPEGGNRISVVSMQEHRQRRSDKDDVRPHGFSEEDEGHSEEDQEEYRSEADLESEHEEEPEHHFDDHCAEHEEERLESEVIRQMILIHYFQSKISMDKLRVQGGIDKRDAEQDAHSAQQPPDEVNAHLTSASRWRSRR